MTGHCRSNPWPGARSGRLGRSIRTRPVIRTRTVVGARPIGSAAVAAGRRTTRPWPIPVVRPVAAARGGPSRRGQGAGPGRRSGGGPERRSGGGPSGRAQGGGPSRRGGGGPSRRPCGGRSPRAHGGGDESRRCQGRGLGRGGPEPGPDRGPLPGAGRSAPSRSGRSPGRCCHDGRPGRPAPPGPGRPDRGRSSSRRGPRGPGRSGIHDLLGPPPALAITSVLDKDAARRKLVAQTVRGGEVAAGTGLTAGLQEGRQLRREGRPLPFVLGHGQDTVQVADARRPREPRRRWRGSARRAAG